MTMREKFERLVFQCVINYDLYMNKEQMVERSLITMHKVGHNGTHEFWIGMLPSDQLVYIASCEDCHTEMCMVYPVGEHPSCIGNR